jgi:hypothetical protein
MAVLEAETRQGTSHAAEYLSWQAVTRSCAEVSSMKTGSRMMQTLTETFETMLAETSASDRRDWLTRLVEL